MKKISSFLCAVALIPAAAFAQNEIDALRYSQSALAGTARFVSMGGAFGALGADFSALSYNPAGIGLYRKSEFTFTPSIYTEKTTTDFSGSRGSDNKFNFNFGDVGLVLTRRLSRNDSTPGWKNINFAIGYNRLNNFHTRSSYQGINHNNSFLDYILEGVNSGNVTPDNMNPYDEQLAYDAYLINPNPSNAGYYNSVIPNGGELQRRSSETKGSMGELALTLGSNYSHRFYIGGTLGIDFLHYRESTTYQEIDQNENIQGFDNFSFTQNLTTNGVGVNFKFGAIFRANDWVRFGAAIHTPTFYTMHDDYSNGMTALTDSGSYSLSSPIGAFDYSLTTPFKAIGSVAFIIGKMGLVSADYEYVDYSDARLSADNTADFYDVNNTIRNIYSWASNIKIGTEWRVGDIYSVRAGYAFFGSPFASGVAVKDYDQEKTSITAGFGIRDAKYFIDLGYAYTVSHDFFRQYSLSFNEVPGAYNKVVSNNFMVTFGWRF